MNIVTEKRYNREVGQIKKTIGRISKELREKNDRYQQMYYYTKTLIKRGKHKRDYGRMVRDINQRSKAIDGKIGQFKWRTIVKHKGVPTYFIRLTRNDFDRLRNLLKLDFRKQR